MIEIVSDDEERHQTPNKKFSTPKVNRSSSHSAQPAARTTSSSHTSPDGLLNRQRTAQLTKSHVQPTPQKPRQETVSNKRNLENGFAYPSNGEREVFRQVAAESKIDSGPKDAIKRENSANITTGSTPASKPTARATDKSLGTTSTRESPDELPSAASSCIDDPEVIFVGSVTREALRGTPDYFSNGNASPKYRVVGTGISTPRSLSDHRSPSTKLRKVGHEYRQFATFQKPSMTQETHPTNHSPDSEEDVLEDLLNHRRGRADASHDEQKLHRPMHATECVPKARDQSLFSSNAGPKRAVPQGNCNWESFVTPGWSYQDDGNLFSTTRGRNGTNTGEERLEVIELDAEGYQNKETHGENEEKTGVPSIGHQRRVDSNSHIDRFNTLSENVPPGRVNSIGNRQSEPRSTELTVASLKGTLHKQREDPSSTHSSRLGSPFESRTVGQPVANPAQTEPSGTKVSNDLRDGSTETLPDTEQVIANYWTASHRSARSISKVPINARVKSLHSSVCNAQGHALDGSKILQDSVIQGKKAGSDSLFVGDESDTDDDGLPMHLEEAGRLYNGIRPPSEGPNPTTHILPKPNLSAGDATPTRKPAPTSMKRKYGQAPGSAFDQSEGQGHKPLDVNDTGPARKVRRLDQAATTQPHKSAEINPLPRPTIEVRKQASRDAYNLKRREVYRRKRHEKQSIGKRGAKVCNVAAPDSNPRIAVESDNPTFKLFQLSNRRPDSLPGQGLTRKTYQQTADKYVNVPARHEADTTSNGSILSSGTMSASTATSSHRLTFPSSTGSQSETHQVGNKETDESHDDLAQALEAEIFGDLAAVNANLATSGTCGAAETASAPVTANGHSNAGTRHVHHLPGSFAEEEGDSEEDEDESGSDSDTPVSKLQQSAAPKGTRQPEKQVKPPATRKTAKPAVRESEVPLRQRIASSNSNALQSSIRSSQAVASAPHASDHDITSINTFWEYHVLRSTLEYVNDEEVITRPVSIGRYLGLKEANEVARKEAFRLHAREGDHLLGAFDELSVRRDPGNGMLTLVGQSATHGNVMVYVERIEVADADDPRNAVMATLEGKDYLPCKTWTVWERQSRGRRENGVDPGIPALIGIHTVVESANHAACDLLMRHLRRLNPAGRLTMAEQAEQIELGQQLRAGREAADGQGVGFKGVLDVGDHDEISVWVAPRPLEGPRN